MTYAEFFKGRLNGLDLFILLMHIFILKQNILSTLTFLTVLYFEVSDLCIYSLNSNCATWHCRLLISGCTIFITRKLELQYDYIAIQLVIYLLNMLVQTFIYYQFCLKVHGTTISALHELSDISCMFYQSFMHVYACVLYYVYWY